MVNEKILTVVIPTKNRSELLKRSVESFSNLGDLLNLVVVDDGSSKEQASKNKEIVEKMGHYCRLPNSFGGPYARNFGAKKSNSQFIWFFDDDDSVSENTIKKVIKVLEGKPKADVILLPMKIIENNTSQKIIVPDQNKNNFETYRVHGHQVNTSCTIIKRDSFIKAGMWDENLMAGQDTDLFLRLSTFSKYLCLDIEPVNVFVDHTDRITDNTSKQHKAKKQFLLKNWNLLSWKRRLFYLRTYIATYPIVTKFRKLIR